MWHLDLTKFVGHIHELGKRSLFKKKYTFIGTQKLEPERTLIKPS
jgi:hypothetical protein